MRRTSSGGRPGRGKLTFTSQGGGAPARYPDKFHLHSLSPSRQSPVFRAFRIRRLTPGFPHPPGAAKSRGAREMEHTPSSRPAIPRSASDAKSETSPGSTAVMSAATVGLSPASSLGPGGGGPPQKRARTSEGAAARERAGVPRVSYPKKRVNVACEVCRSRKTRCDAARPSCSFCAEIGARCVYRRPEETSRLVSPRWLAVLSPLAWSPFARRELSIFLLCCISCSPPQGCPLPF